MIVPFSTTIFLLMANRKRQFQVRGLAFDVCGLYRFSYENMKEFFHFREVAILNFQTKAVFDFQMATKSLVLTLSLKITYKLELKRLV